MNDLTHGSQLLDHVHLHVKELRRSLVFYRAVLDAIGHGHRLQVDGGYFVVDELFVDADPGAVPRPIHFAFVAPDRESVRRFHKAGLAAGGTDNGTPGLREKYHPDYYAAYVIDPDGNNVEAVHHGPGARNGRMVFIPPA